MVYNDAASVPADLEIKAVILAYDVLEVRPLFSPRMQPTMCATLFGLYLVSRFPHLGLLSPSCACAKSHLTHLVRTPCCFATGVALGHLAQRCLNARNLAVLGGSRHPLYTHCTALLLCFSTALLLSYGKSEGAGDAARLWEGLSEDQRQSVETLLCVSLNAQVRAERVMGCKMV